MRSGCRNWDAGGQGRQWSSAPSQHQRVQQAIRLWLVHRKKPVPVVDLGLPPKRCRKEGQQERKEQPKQQGLGEHKLGEDPPSGVQRVWTDGSQKTGKDGRQYTGYGVWFGERHALNHCAKLPGLVQTNNRAELHACVHVLEVAPRHVPLQLCVDSQLVADGVTLWLPGWIRRKWKTKQGLL